MKATAAGLSIDAGAAGTYVWSFPKLLTRPDQALKAQQVTVKPDGSGAIATYDLGAKVALDKLPDGSWCYHLTGIPPDHIKFTFGFGLPLTLADDGATWSLDGGTAQTFPKVKGELNLFQGNAQSFTFRNKGGGFTITFPAKLWTMVSDQRKWGQDHFSYAQLVLFPGKKGPPDISYTYKIEALPKASAPGSGAL